MQQIRFLVVLMVFTSCELFISKERQMERRVNQELMAIDWDSVDQYPLFDNCDENVSKEIQKACFETTMLNHFAKAFSGLQFEVEQDMNDTIKVDFLIDEHGFITIRDIEENGEIMAVLPNIKQEITTRLNDLTTVAPAIKQGVPVGVSIRLPLILKTTE